MPCLVVDRDACMSSGQCYVTYPRLVQPDEDDVPVPTAEEFPEEDRDELLALTEVCPTGALSVTD